MATPMRRFQRRAPAKARTYIPVSGDVSVGTASLADNAQAAIVDSALANPTTSQAYGRGVLGGLRVNVSLYPAADTKIMPEVFVLILPLGLAVPSLLTPALIKANERFVWLRGQFRCSMALSATAATYTFEAAPKTKRRFEMNDRLVVVILNQTGVAFGAGSNATSVIDVFATED